MFIPDLSEGEARGRLRNLYHHLKTTLHAPLVGDVFRALAHYPSFLSYALETSKSNLLSQAFEQFADELRAVPPPDSWQPRVPPYVTRRDLRGGAEVLPVFHYLNAKLLLVTTAWYESLSERPIRGTQQGEAFIPPGIPAYFPRQVPLLRYELAPTHIQQLLQQTVDARGGFVPHAEYRALAHYPTFLAGAWQEVQTCLGTPWYRDTSRRLLQRATTLVHRLPCPLPLSPVRLRQVMSEREIASCIAIVAMYRQTLPGLILEVELMMSMVQQSAKRFWI